MSKLFSEGKKELKGEEELHTSQELYEKSQNEHNIYTYSKKKGVPPELVESLEMEPDLIGEEERKDIEKEIKEEEFNAMESVKRMFDENPDLAYRGIRYHTYF